MDEVKSNNNLISACFSSFPGSFQQDSEKNNFFVTGCCNEPITGAEFSGVIESNAISKRGTFEAAKKKPTFSNTYNRNFKVTNQIKSIELSCYM